MRAIFLILLLTLTSIASAKIDFSQFELTEKQRGLLERLEKRGIKTDVLIRFAKSLERENREGPRQEYIPPPTPAQLEEVVHWAKGGAFAGAAARAGYRFDFEAYEEDCPNLALFNFGRATATQYLCQDVLSRALQVSTALRIKRFSFSEKGESTPEFSDYFIEYAESEGFGAYLIPIEPDSSVAQL